MASPALESTENTSTDVGVREAGGCPVMKVPGDSAGCPVMDGTLDMEAAYDNFDQRSSLCIPPVSRDQAWHRMSEKGLFIPDIELADVPTADLIKVGRHGHPVKSVPSVARAVNTPDPEWVDWEKCKRGQAWHRMSEKGLFIPDIELVDVPTADLIKVGRHGHPVKSVPSVARAVNTPDPKWVDWEKCKRGQVGRHGHLARAVNTPDPEWLNWERCKRGQKVYHDYSAHLYFSLLGLLLNGFSIGRFSEVLVLSNYTSSPRETYKRFEKTGEEVFRWTNYDLSNDESEGRESIASVRCRHELARRHVSKLRPYHFELEGVALSQFDMAQVQLTFGMLAFFVMEKALCPLSRQQSEDVLHLWRLIGYRLGIMDEYNACNDLEDSYRLRDELFMWAPLYHKSIRESTKTLLYSTLDGFADVIGGGSRARLERLTTLTVEIGKTEELEKMYNSQKTDASFESSIQSTAEKVKEENKAWKRPTGFNEPVQYPLSVFLVLRFFSLKVPRTFLNNAVAAQIRLYKFKHTKVGATVTKTIPAIVMVVVGAVAYLKFIGS